MENSINIQARLDLCTLATLAKAYIGEGAILRSKSDLVWKAIEHIVSMYESNGIKKFTDVYEALDYMDKIGLYLDTSKRTKRQVQTAMVNQNAVSDFGVQNFGRPMNRKQVIDESQRTNELKAFYAILVDHNTKNGLPIPTFEEYRVIATKPLNYPEEETVVETTNPEKFVAKEKERMAAEKAAYSPEALRNAMVK